MKQSPLYRQMGRQFVEQVLKESSFLVEFTRTKVASSWREDVVELASELCKKAGSDVRVVDCARMAMFMAILAKKYGKGGAIEESIIFARLSRIALLGEDAAHAKNIDELTKKTWGLPTETPVYKYGRGSDSWRIYYSMNGNDPIIYSIVHKGRNGLSDNSGDIRRRNSIREGMVDRKLRTVSAAVRAGVIP
jgi:hypothetical protein